MSKCPTCGAGFTRTEYCCRECGHILRETVVLRMSFASREEVQEHFGRYPTFASLFLPVAEPLPEGTLVELRLALPEEAEEVSVPARVVAAAPTPSTPATPYKLHLNLLHLDATKKGLIKDIISGEPPPAASAPVPEPTPARLNTRPRAAIFPPPSKPVTAERKALDLLHGEEVEFDLDALLSPLAPATVPGLPLPPPPSEPWTREKVSPHQADLLADFVVRLTKALTASTYYEADHQAAMKAKLGLYDTFKMVVQGSPEVSFLDQAQDGRHLLVYGLFEEPKDLDRVMARGQAELFVPKLAAYMQSRSLLGLSFKRAIEHAEFYKFVDLLATPVYLARESRHDLSARMATEGISNVSLVLKEDFTPRRKMSWRVAAAVTRLKKDLSVLPYFSSRGPEELRAARYGVFRDVVRPLRQVKLVRELLVNCDLVAQEGAGLLPEELEQLVLETLPTDALPDLLSVLTEDVLAAGLDQEPAQRQLLERLTRNLARRLAGAQGALLEREFLRLHERGVLALEDLPAVVQDRLRIQDRVVRFLENWDAHLRVFDEISAGPLYQRHLDFLTLIYPELLSRREMEPVIQIGLLVAKHRVADEPYLGRRRMAAAWISGVAASPAGGEMVAQLMTPDRGRREALMNLCGILGEGAVPILFKALCDCPSRSIRLELCELLVGLREPTMLFLAAELEKKSIPWYFQRNLLNLMGRIGDVSSLPMVGRFMSDKHPRVRLEALLAACALDPVSAESHLLWGLTDQDPDVRGVSLRHLVQRRSVAAELFEHCRQVLADPQAEDEGRAVCSLLTSYQAGAGHEDAVELLLEVVGDEPRKRMFGFLKPAEDTQIGVRVSAIQALGRLRARTAVSVLTRIAEGRNAGLRQSASVALRLIQQGERV